MTQHNQHFLCIDTNTMYAVRYKDRVPTGEITHIDGFSDGCYTKFKHEIEMFRLLGWDN